MAAVTRAPWADRLGLHVKLLDHNTHTEDLVTFVREIHAHLQRPIILVWDRLPAHRSAIRQLLDHGGHWLRVAWLPPYAPDLDPVEAVWEQSKYGTLANIIPDDIAHLHSMLTDVFDNYRLDRNRLHSFFCAARLY
jgi:hypothetical protein